MLHCTVAAVRSRVPPRDSRTRGHGPRSPRSATHRVESLVAGSSV